MAFSAVTLHREIGVGASFCITEEPRLRAAPTSLCAREIHFISRWAPKIARRQV